MDMHVISVVCIWTCMSLVLCAPSDKEADDIHSILEDILKRLDEKETIIRQLEAIVSVQDATMREQQGQMTTLEVEVAIQKVMIQVLQEKVEVYPQIDNETTATETVKSSRIKTGSICHVVLLTRHLNS